MNDFLGNPSDEWYERFPIEAIDRILEYVSTSWEDLKTRFPGFHHAGETEPRLTKSLSDYLDDAVRRRSAGVGGRFHSERGINERDAKGRVRQAGRTDIEYHFPRPGQAALVLEFKKLEGSSRWRRHYRVKGMLKFINGLYATTEMYGAMCGLVSCDRDAEIKALTKSILRDHKNLGCVDSAVGSPITTPSKIAPSVAAFDTEHKRTGVVATGSIRLSHLFLALHPKLANKGPA